MQLPRNFTAKHGESGIQPSKPMTCDTSWRMMSDFSDGQLPREQAALLEGHLAECGACAEDFEFMQLTQAALADLEEVAPPQGMREAILAATSHQPARSAPMRSKRPAYLRYFGIAAAGAGAATVLLFMRPAARGPEAPVRTAQVAPQANPAPFTEPSAPSFQPDSPLHELTPPARAHVADLASATARPPMAPPIATPAAGKILVSVGAPTRAVASQYKAKTGVRPVESDLVFELPDAMLEPEMMMMMAETGMPVVTMNPETIAKIEPAVSGTVGAGPTHIVLTATSAGMDAGHYASLADLKRALRKQAVADANSKSIVESVKLKQIRLDVFKGSF